MPAALIAYVRAVDAANRRVGRFAMYLVFAIMAVLVWSILAKNVARPALWTQETAQFLLMAYYFLGGAWAMQQGDHVRMDLFYAGWPPRRKAAADSVTVLLLLTYLAVLLYGGISSTSYAIEVGERANSPWRPYMWPVKLVGTAGIVLMLLQAAAELVRDIARLRGLEIGAAVRP